MNPTHLIKVYYTNIPENGEISPVYPIERQREIEACASEKTRREKHYAWKLLETAIQDFLGCSIREVEFWKSESGKWKSNRVEFSLSHSANAVAVALSPVPVGVDIQRLTPLKRTNFFQHILSKQELERSHALAENEKTEYLIKKWTEKESAFKLLDSPGFLSANPPSFSAITQTQTVAVKNENYALTVAVNTPCAVQFISLQ